MRRIFQINVIALLILLTGCAGVILHPGAENVVVTKSHPPKYCKYVGRVSSADINGSTIWYSSDKNIHYMEMAELKNQAFAMGANCVEIVNHYYSKYKHSGGFSLTENHRLSGNAYRCPNQAYIGSHFNADVTDD